MNTWILILTLINQQSMGGHSSQSSAIQTIEFNSKEACLAAGNAWVKKVPDSNFAYRKLVSALCVQK